MTESFDVKQRSLGLANTMQDGLEYIRLRFAEGSFEETITLMQDITQAFISIQEALAQGGEEVDSTHLTDGAQVFQAGLAVLVSSFERAEWENVVLAMENQIMPGFRSWKDELEHCFRQGVQL